MQVDEIIEMLYFALNYNPNGLTHFKHGTMNVIY
jgi:hypothetical protein